MMNGWIYKSNKVYSTEEIENRAIMATIINDADNTLTADTPEREYVFRAEGDGWVLDHTWRHFILGKH